MASDGGGRSRGWKADGNGVDDHLCVEGSQVGGVCGTKEGTSVRDAEIREKVVQVEGMYSHVRRDPVAENALTVVKP